MVIIVVLIILGGIGYIWMAKSKPQIVSSVNLQAKDVQVLGREHVPQEEWEKFKYNSNPPTSGSHDEIWTKSGVYKDAQGDGHLVHSLEHGYIIISHNCGVEASSSAKASEDKQNSKAGTESAEMEKECMDFVNKLEELVKKDSWKMIVIPRPSLDTDFALTAWGKIDKFDIKDASLDRVNAFIEAFRNHGPEQTME